MKKVIFALSIILIIPACSQQAPGDKEVKLFLGEATEKANAVNKTLILEFWAPECGPCMRLKRDIFENENTKDLLSSAFYLVQVSPADSIYRKLWNHFHLVYQSTVVFFDKSGNEIDRTVSYDGNRDSYLNFLKDVASGNNLFVNVYQAFLKDSSDVTINYLLANKFFFRNQLKDAYYRYNRVTELDPADKSGFNSECVYKMAECDFLQKGSLEKMKDFLKNDPGGRFAPKAYEYLIGDLINKKDTSNCLAACETAFQKHPGSWEILNKYAWAICTFKKEKDYEKALAMARKSIELNPFRAGTYSTEAWIHFEMGNKEKAIELQTKAIEIYPNPSYLNDLEKFKTSR
ncbi:MAG: thioredoxin family protein [Bacteroidales bacterium]